MTAALTALQTRLQAFLLRGESDVMADVSGSPDIDPRRRLGIYYDAYRLRLMEALRTDYPALPVLMGDDDFDRAALRYIECTPSPHRNLRWYGGDLPGFLRSDQPQRGWLADLAQFEWTITLAFDAPDHPSLDFASVAALAPQAWPTVRFRFHPSLHRLELTSNAPALRKAVDEEATMPSPELLEHPVSWMLWRKDFTVLYRSLPPAEAWALDTARAGADFTALCEGLCEFVDAESAASQLAGMLRAWVDDALVVALEE